MLLITVTQANNLFNFGLERFIQMCTEKWDSMLFVKWDSVLFRNWDSVLFRNSDFVFFQNRDFVFFQKWDSNVFRNWDSVFFSQVRVWFIWKLRLTGADWPSWATTDSGHLKVVMILVVRIFSRDRIRFYGAILVSS